MEQLQELLKEFTGTPLVHQSKMNYINIKCSLLTPNIENANKFNKILKYLKENIENKVPRTKSGGISTSGFVWIPSYDYTYSGSGAELLIITEFGMYRIQFRPKLTETEDSKSMSGRKAFNKFKEILSENGINLDDYAVDNGEEVKKEIESPMIKMDNNFFISTKDENGIRNAHHIDFHNSYPGGLMITHPEFKSVIEMMYNKRKENPIYKAILNYSIGFMQSKWVGYKYAALSRDAINNNNARLRRVAQALKDTGRTVLAYNTDGIWYCGDIYHGEGEGKNVGQWENDHTNCTIRFKSAGAYEFIENGQYHPVVRGYTKLDIIKPRDNWEWGDIYQNSVIIFGFTKDGIVGGM